MSNAAKNEFFERALLQLFWPKLCGDHVTERIAAARSVRAIERPHMRLDHSMDRRHGRSSPIRTVERVTTTTLTVTWSDACAGFSAEQRWHLTRARCKTVCALTRTAISRGDAVYRPRACASHVPENRHWMILASQIEHFPISNELEVKAF
ncbi:DUF3331 domain-containing protein [Paraburkholderia strydomiana]|uniref:DUF3331 domain-containing protein n=1 Tax=Paraburkholderia strydomiana TaxID=1245417 RepID=UPI0038BDDA56